MVYVDVHCHLDFKDFDVDRDEFVKKLEEDNVIALSNTLNYKNYLETKELYKNVKNVKVCPGLYPQESEKLSDKEFEDYLVFLEEHQDDYVMIGEVGLDKHHTTDEELFNVQVKRFKSLVELAIKIDKPMSIHARKAEGVVLDILTEYVEKTGFRKFDLHCFMGKKKYFEVIKKLKIYVSIPLIVLNTQSFQNLVEFMPIRQILVETDSPFLDPSRERNSPLNVPKIYAEIAKIKGYDLKEIENIIYSNYQRFTL